MTKEKEGFIENDEDERQSQYNEDAFNNLVENDEGSSADDEPELSDFTPGTEDSDGNTDTGSKAQPKGEEGSGENSDSDTDKANKDDPESDKDAGPELPPWMEALPEDQKDAAVTDYLKMHTDLDKLQARHDSMSGHLKPTQRKLARLEERLKLAGAIKPGDDLEERSAKVEAWIEKHGEDYPEEAEDLKATFDAYKQTVTDVADDADKYRSTLDDRTDEDDSVDRGIQRKLLERMDDNAAQISVDPSFMAYLQQHPEHAAQAQSPFAHDVIEVIDHFRNDTEWQPPMTSDEFLNVNQMLVSPMFSNWGQAIGLTAQQVTGLDQVGQAKVFTQFKDDLDAAHQPVNDDENSDADDNSDEAVRLAEQRKKRKKDHSPAARGSGTGGGKPTALKGEGYFDQLEV